MDVQRLAKVLALAASDNEAEALHALRTAGRLLEAAGMDFVSLAGRLAEGGAAPLPNAERLEDLEDALFDLRNEVRRLRSENERLRQGGAAPSGLAEAAQDAAHLIRLTAELGETREALAVERRRAERAEGNEQSLHTELVRALGAAETLTTQVETLKGRCDRLEAENRRLGLVAKALRGEMDEMLADRNHPLPPPASLPPPAPVVAVAEPAPRRAVAAPTPPAVRRGKVAPPAGQYALF